MKRVFVLGAAIAAAIASPANAGEFLVEVGAPLQSPNGGGNDDTPKFRVVNTTPGSATTPYLLSLVLSLDATTSSTITALSNFGGGSFNPGVDNQPSMSAPSVSFSSKLATLTYDATDFDPGAYSTFTVNFGPGSSADFRTALFNGTNTLTAMFSDNTTAQVTFNGSPTSNADSFGFSSTSVAAVPEPATWAMMLLGFGVIGGFMRRRSPTAARGRIAFN
ncbi:PEPxxWA-CTERM sorting domain-containing protein [Sphingomonas sp. M1-B02]|uniref:PEPxxWA-CTERM sorting domain-containing protein n=1 Tax=Sphingomonas sp. M1-B02 TaxID=3114300 RepID=UPI00223EB833|nr:PEPxxWA-CTERM sorting domain-containing protein [Sphingomonas sp. S6-11]UZK67736.1 PEPxxWA-CTERM sorting domain-containing protein [Sphingomonas sp. S6-11]